MPRIEFEPLKDLFVADATPLHRELLRDPIIQDFKQKNLIGVPDAQLQITFDGADGSDILIQRVDPEKALGYSVHASAGDYYGQLSASLYEPTEEDILGGSDGNRPA